jgi:hypothetical protein
VFADYRKFLAETGPTLRYLPTPAFYYAMDVGSKHVREPLRRDYNSFTGRVKRSMAIFVGIGDR